MRLSPPPLGCESVTPFGSTLNRKSFEHPFSLSTLTRLGDIVSNSESIAVAKPSARAFTCTLLLGGLTVAAWLATQRMDFDMRRPVSVEPPSPIQLMRAPEPVQPSAYDEESTMPAAQLLDRWDGMISEASRRFRVPKAWIRAVMRQESGGRTMLGHNQPIVSRAGAIGLMQVLPATYAEMAQEHRLGNNPFDARANIMAGAAYLRWLRHKYGYPAMFAAYNAGPGRLEDHLERGVRLPPETRAYVGGIAKTLKLQTTKFQIGKSGLDLVQLTRPDGVPVRIDPAQVTAVRAAEPGEFASSVKTVLVLGKRKQQGIREDVLAVTAAVRAAGKTI